MDHLLDLGSPYHYYAEFKPKETNQLTSIGALCRITGFLNAAARVRILTTISDLSFKNQVLYLDNQHLFLKNATLRPYHMFSCQQTDASPHDLGKWQLVAETAIGRTAASTASIKITDWLALVRHKPINLAALPSNRNSQMNLLRHY